MNTPIPKIYKQLNDRSGLLYAWFLSMHTRVDIVLYDRKSEEELVPVIRQIYEELQQLEKTGNFYCHTSELYQVNQTAAQHPVKISHSLYSLIDLSLEYHEKTFGCFDVTIQSDHYNQETWHSVLLSPENQTVSYQMAGTRIDLSGLLKGYALERIREILNSHEINNALINMGNSSVLALGNHPHGNKGWKVSFGTQAASTVVNKEGILLYNQCLTTSGNDSEERKHIISPQSGKRIEGIRRVAVVTDDGAVGEVLSTSLFVATSEQRETLIEQFQIKEIVDI